MTRRAGSADLPLHGGRVPKWLGDRMTRLGAVMCEAIVHHYGRDELLRRLAHPFWFQSFGAVMGMDWHSSGITTSVIGALKRGLQPLSGELGLHVCGGRGKHSRKTPDELVAVGDRVGLDGAALAKASRLVAKVDSAAVQDGFELYLHGFIVADDGSWVVVQQGMNEELRQARRYHWLSAGLKSFVEEPHAAIEGERRGNIINLTDRRAEASRRGQLDLLQTHGAGPDRARAVADRGQGEGVAVAAPAPGEQMALPLSDHAGASRRARRGRDGAAAERQSCRRCRIRAGRFRRAAAGAGRRRAHGAGRSPWCRRWCTARRAASATRRGFRSRMAARTGIRFRCRSASMTRRSAS